MVEYDDQRALRAEQIVERLKALAKERGVEITDCGWDDRGGVIEHARHELAANTKSKSVTATFSDEQLADYPGKVGTGATEGMLREMVNRLK